MNNGYSPVTLALLGLLGLPLLTASKGDGCLGDVPDYKTDTGVVTSDLDNDGDGYSEDSDCNDTNAEVHPGATETCDEVDNDCDGYIDSDDPGADDTWYYDADGDGYGDLTTLVEICPAPAGYIADGTDCDDTDTQVYPGAPERCDSLDNDCDGVVDNDIIYTWYADDDGDGYGDPADTTSDCDPGLGWTADSTDCDDHNSAISPGDTEACNGYDDDCDGTTDESDAVDASTWYQDRDSDNYGDLEHDATLACEQPTGYADNSTDCDDEDATAHPGATEICDGADNDCDGVGDEVAYWDFNEGSGTTAGDSISALDGVVTNGTWTTGHSGNALDFARTGYVEADYPELELTTALTVSAWVNPDAITSSVGYTILAVGSDTGNGNPYWLGYASSSLYFYTGYDPADPVAPLSTTSVSKDAWSHVLATWDITTGDRALYVDGVLVDSDSDSVLSPVYDSAPLLIGADTNTGVVGAYFDGTIDEVQMFGCVADTTAAAADYSTGWPY